MSPRIQPVPRARRPLLARAANWYVRRRLGQKIDSVNILAHSPTLLLPALMASQLGSAKTALPEETKALAMHLVAAKNGCAWCIDFGLAAAIEAGLPLEKLLEAPDYATDPRFSAAERAALAYAAHITDGGGHVPDEVFDALKPHYTDREIVELTLMVAIENFYNRMNGPLGIPSQGFCVLPASLAHTTSAQHPHPVSAAT